MIERVLWILIIAFCFWKLSQNEIILAFFEGLMGA